MHVQRGTFPPGYFTGDTTSWAHGDALFAEVLHREAKTVPVHAHAAAYFSLLLDGSYAERAEDFDVVYEPYTLVFHAAATLHKDNIGPGGCRFFTITLGASWQEAIEQLGGTRAHIFELTGGDATWLTLGLYREFLQRNDDETVHALLLELCSYAAQAPVSESREPEWLADVDNRLQQRFTHPIDLPDLAAVADVHPSHVCRVYRRFRGKSVSQAVNDLRIQFVCRQLREGNRLLSAIAAEAGFADQSHMTRAFVRTTGRSPAEHRRSMPSMMKRGYVTSSAKASTIETVTPT